MVRWIAPLMLLMTPGCAICSRCFDEAYPHSGGAVERHDLFCGRVASAFTPDAGSPAGVLHPTRLPPGGETIAPGPVQQERREPAPREDSNVRPRPQSDLPEPEERPPAAEALQNTLRGT